MRSQVEVGEIQQQLNPTVILSGSIMLWILCSQQSQEAAQPLEFACISNAKQNQSDFTARRLPIAVGQAWSQELRGASDVGDYPCLRFMNSLFLTSFFTATP